MDGGGLIKRTPPDMRYLRNGLIEIRHYGLQVTVFLSSSSLGQIAGVVRNHLRDTFEQLLLTSRKNPR